jgi:HemY protein
LWGKSRDYFEKSYRLQRSPEICAELGRLLSGMGQANVAAAYFREGLLLQENHLPKLPRPDKIVPDQRLLTRG